MMRLCTTRQRFLAFSLIELLISITILGIVIFPIFSVFRTGKKGTLQNRDYFMAFNLARSRMEELKLLPYSKLTSDFDTFAAIYSDAVLEEFTDMDVNEDLFVKRHTDIFTDESSKKFSDIYEQFCTRYQDYYGRPYKLFSEEYVDFRRVAFVTQYNEKCKKIKVQVRSAKSGKPIAELVTLVEEQ
jgi:type II secretory pathway pseudopilin PulG